MQRLTKLPAAIPWQSPISGDNHGAIKLWQSAVVEIEQEGVGPCVEVGQIYYFLGKCQGDEGFLKDSIATLSRAEEVFFAAEPGHPNVQDVKYHLGALLRKAGDEDGATVRFKQALGLVDEPLASCLEGPKQDDLSLKAMIKYWQKCGLMNELSPGELKRIAALLVEEGRFDQGGDINDIHPFDLCFLYYFEHEARCEQDGVVCADFPPELRPLEKLSWSIESLNRAVGQEIFAVADLATVDMNGEHLFLIVDHDENSEEGPVAAAADDFEALVRIFNTRLQFMEAERRVLRFAAYDDRDAVIVLSKSMAGKLYRGGAGRFFENLSTDIEPKAPPLSRLSK